MKHLNNKGFAISGILYSLLLLVVVLMFLIIILMVTGRMTLTKLNKAANTIIDERNYKYDPTLDRYADGGAMMIGDPTGCTETPQLVVLEEGTYRFEVWGAQGGSYGPTYGNARTGPVTEGGTVSGLNDIAGGHGGYSSGVITLEKTTGFYLTIGCMPILPASYIPGGRCTRTTASLAANTCDYPGGYNGGGMGSIHRHTNNGMHTFALGGGGATDIRVALEPSLGVYVYPNIDYRIIVAGGGSGATVNGNGGAALAGNHANGLDSTTPAGYPGLINRGGYATKGWIVQYPPTTTTSVNLEFTTGGVVGVTAGTYGQGGHSYSNSAGFSAGPGGGGGGWYGGGSGTSYTNPKDYMGGGSGFVATAANYDKWGENPSIVGETLTTEDYNKALADRSRWLYGLDRTKYYFTNAKSLGGNVNVPVLSVNSENRQVKLGTSRMGHRGHGMVVITECGASNLSNGYCEL